MSLLIVTRDDAAQRLAQHTNGAPDSTEALCEVLRAEVHSRKHAPRASTLSRVARLLAPAFVVKKERLDHACAELEHAGDLVLAPGGILYATPTRAIALNTTAHIVSSVPTPALAAILERPLAAKGATRTVSATDGLPEAIAGIGGVMVSPETWAGLDRTPPADAAFLRQLDHRLEWEPQAANSLAQEGELDWRAWQITDDGAKWRRSPRGRLWWARTRFGGHHRTWTAGAPPTSSPFIALSADEADRARFALMHEIGGRSVFTIERANELLIIGLPGWLPRPEYRWLSLHGAPVADSKGMRWQFAVDDAGPITKLLAARLGLSPKPIGEKK